MLKWLRHTIINILIAASECSEWVATLIMMGYLWSIWLSRFRHGCTASSKLDFWTGWLAGELWMILWTGSTSVSGEHEVQCLAVTVVWCSLYFFLEEGFHHENAKLNVFIKLIVVSAMYIEEEIMLFWVFSSVCKYKSCIRMSLPMEEPQKAFDNQTIPDVKKYLPTYLPDCIWWFEMTANPSTPNQNAFKKVTCTKT